MALNKITYTDKVALNPQPSVADENKCTDSDLNEIKNVVNDAIDYLEQETTSTGWINISATGFNCKYKRCGNVVCIKGFSNANITISGYGQTILGTLPSSDLRPTETIRSLPYARGNNNMYIQVADNTSNVIVFNWGGAVSYTDGGQFAFTLTYII